MDYLAQLRDDRKGATVRALSKVVLASTNHVLNWMGDVLEIFPGKGIQSFSTGRRHMHLRFQLDAF